MTHPFCLKAQESPLARTGIVSPNIDKMADSGLRLSDYYVQEMCTPTRAALMTGQLTTNQTKTNHP